MLLQMTLLLFTATAAVQDRKCSRISNALIGVAAANGCFLQIYTNGWSGLFEAVMGAIIPLLLCGWLFVLAMLGAGDLKLLMAVGIYTGIKGITGVIVLAFIGGAVLSLAKLLRYGLIRERFAYLLSYLEQIKSGKYVPYMDMACPEQNEKWTIRFAVPVFLAVLISLLISQGDN